MIDQLLAERMADHGALFVIAVAFLLGLRHATDPDHVVAVSTVVASARERRARAAARLGLAWGTGHALTLVAVGLPVVVFHAFIPDVVQRLAEALIGLVIVVLAVRLLHLWRRGALHVHEHEHDGTRHAHLHSHARAPGHQHVHRVRSTRQAFAVGIAHGFAGSAGVTVLLVAALPGRAVAAAALAVVAAATAVAMTGLTSALGSLLATTRGRWAFAHAAPAVGVLCMAFGAWYAASALATA